MKEKEEIKRKCPYRLMTFSFIRDGGIKSPAVDWQQFYSAVDDETS